MNLGTAILLIVVAGIAGYVFGLVDKRFTNALRKKKENPAEEPIPVLPPQPDVPAAEIPLKITIDKDKKFNLEVDGVLLSSPEAISAEQRQRLINLLVQVRPWLEQKPAAKPPAAAPATPAPTSPAPAASQPVRPANPTPVPAVTPPEVPSVSLIKGISSMVTKDVRMASEKKPSSIVGMIDQVLQARLEDSPLKEKGIRLEDGPMGGVIVWVGNQRYSGIDAVPDQQIQVMIKSAVAEWEKS